MGKDGLGGSISGEIGITTVYDSSRDLKELTKRIKQLEDSMLQQGMFLPPKPDPTLAQDEWHAIFSDFQNLETGTITKIPWGGGLNSTSTFKVKRID